MKIGPTLNSSSACFSASEIKAELNLGTFGIATCLWNSERSTVEVNTKHRSLIEAFHTARDSGLYLHDFEWAKLLELANHSRKESAARQRPKSDQIPS